MTMSSSRGSIVDGEFVMTTGNFRQIAQFLREDAGIVLHEGKASLVYSRLARRLRALGLPDFDGYCRHLEGPGAAPERREMMAALTTNVTDFFREAHHFEHLRTEVLPPLIEAAKKGKRIRFWSAASSSGQEAYSIALTLLGAMPDAASHDIRILATDIDPNMVSTGRTGRYPEKLLQKVPAGMRSRWFKPVPGQPLLEADPALRRLVSFNELNLLGPWPMRGRFDAIFCRNVVIYFDEATQTELWSRFAPMLTPAGVLYIGHSERIANQAAASYRPAGVTTYALAGHAS